MVIDHNPLVIPVLRLLRELAAPVSEHQLITGLDREWQQLPQLSEAAGLGLFQKHFLVMNALYQLQRELATEGLYLRISPLAIAIEYHAGGDGIAVAEATDKPLADYYLDFSNLADTDALGVERLLNQFWQRYLSQDEWQQALAVLQLSPGQADWQLIRGRYRQLAALLHPDRGGDAAEFVRVREAYECLRARFEP